MEESILKAEGIFGRCTTCFKNLLKGICAVACDPAQDKYLRIVNELQSIDTGRNYVDELEFRMDPEYKAGVFSSCSDVIHPSSGRLALSLACGTDLYKCTPDQLFFYMGDPIGNPLVPFKINYSNIDDPNTRFESETKECTDFYENDFPCSCVDCSASCPISDPPQADDEGFKIGSFNGTTFIISMSIGLIGLLIMAFGLMSKINIGQLPAIFGGFPSFNDELSRFFSWWGRSKLFKLFIINFIKFKCFLECANHPTLVLAITTWVVAILSYGALSLQITTDPVELWANPTSRSRIEKDYFDEKFSPFFRTNQIFAKPKNQDFVSISFIVKIFLVSLSQFIFQFIHETSNGNLTFGPAFEKNFLLEIFKMQQEIEQLGQEDDEGLEKFCFAPMVQFGEKTKLIQCTVQSIFGYFDNSFVRFNASDDRTGYTRNYLNTLNECFENPVGLQCLAPYGGPVEPAIAVGGLAKREEGSLDDFKTARGIILTFLLNNKNDKSELEPEYKWEKRFVDYLANYSSDIMDIAYMAERSIEDGIDAMSEAEVYTVVISYIVMFIYIMFALGKIRSAKYFLLESKITLAIGGIVIVLLSVVCSLGVFGYLGVATTMLTVEVIPFLVLAIGVDNIFILVHTYNRMNREQYDNVADAVGDALGKVGPSILLTATSEIACFLIGALSGMPAVRTFALYASVALLIDFIFQITTFIALMTLDIKRLEGKRLDLFCCFRVKVESISESSHGFLQKIFEKYYTPFLMKKSVRYSVLTFFLVISCGSLIIVPSIEVGLDQELSMPKDSHIVKYFQYMADLLSMGPPVYFVLKQGLNFSQNNDQNLICGGIKCNDNSLNIEIYLASKYPEITKIAKPSQSWLDDYIDWLKIGSCCKYNVTDGSFCLSSGKCDSLKL